MTRVGGDQAGATLEASLAHLADVAIGLAVGFMLEGTGMYDPGDALDPFDGCASMAFGQLRSRVRAAVDELPEQENRVMAAHYFRGEPFADIAVSLGLTRGRVSQIHRSAIHHLRCSLGGITTSFEF